VSRGDWFRNTRWNGKIAAAFAAKLKRARTKGQYLRIQASALAESHPQVTLDLLEQYFSLEEEQFDESLAHVIRAGALSALGKMEDAITSYEAALSHETRRPNVLSGAHLELPYFIAVHSMAGHYERAVELLNAHRDRLTFPVEHFMWHASHALIAGATGDHSAAIEHAGQALEFASLKKSGFSRHPTIGLVAAEHEEVLRRLRVHTDD
jgi:tetratricopeptide (TPR) repeat protein